MLVNQGMNGLNEFEGLGFGFKKMIKKGIPKKSMLKPKIIKPKIIKPTIIKPTLKPKLFKPSIKPKMTRSRFHTSLIKPGINGLDDLEFEGLGFGLKKIAKKVAKKAVKSINVKKAVKTAARAGAAYYTAGASEVALKAAAKAKAMKKTVKSYIKTAKKPAVQATAPEYDSSPMVSQYAPSSGGESYSQDETASESGASAGSAIAGMSKMPIIIGGAAIAVLVAYFMMQRKAVRI